MECTTTFTIRSSERTTKDFPTQQRLPVSIRWRVDREESFQFCKPIATVGNLQSKLYGEADPREMIHETVFNYWPANVGPIRARNAGRLLGTSDMRVYTLAEKLYETQWGGGELLEPTKCEFKIILNGAVIVKKSTGTRKSDRITNFSEQRV